MSATLKLVKAQSRTTDLKNVTSKSRSESKIRLLVPSTPLVEFRQSLPRSECFGYSDVTTFQQEL